MFPLQCWKEKHRKKKKKNNGEHLQPSWKWWFFFMVFLGVGCERNLEVSCLLNMEFPLQGFTCRLPVEEENLINLRQSLYTFWETSPLVGLLGTGLFSTLVVTFLWKKLYPWLLNVDPFIATGSFLTPTPWQQTSRALFTAKKPFANSSPHCPPKNLSPFLKQQRVPSSSTVIDV